jgi:hypothetical protein
VSNRLLEATTLIILLVLAIAIIAFFVPAAFFQLSNPPPITDLYTLQVLSGVTLAYGGTWPPGYYVSCSVSTVSTTCLTATGVNQGSSSISGFISGSYVIIELLFVAALIIMLLMVGYYYYRRR